MPGLPYESAVPQVDCLTSDCLTRRSISRLQMASTALNLRPSLGICCRISSLLKIGSKYSQLCWQRSHSSRMSCQESAAPRHAMTTWQPRVSRTSHWRLATHFSNQQLFERRQCVLWSRTVHPLMSHSTQMR